MRNYWQNRDGSKKRVEMFNLDVTVTRSRSYSGAASYEEAKRKVDEALNIVKDIWAAAPGARRVWMSGCRDGSSTDLQTSVLAAFAVKHVPHLGYQQWLAHVTLQALCLKWEKARGPKWCRAMGSGVATALGSIFNEHPEKYATGPEHFDCRLEQVTTYVRNQWPRINGTADPVPGFDEEDIAPQLCEWHRLGKPSQCIDSPHTQFGFE